MVGYVSAAVAKAISKWETLKDANIIPVRATDGSSVVVNTPLPCVAIHINGEDGEGNTYLGGGIRLYFELNLYVMLPVINYTFSPDAGKQADMLDLSEEVVRCMENSPELNAVKTEHDLNMQFDRLETDTTYATQNAISVCVDIHKVIYRCDVAFDPKDEKYNRSQELKRVEIDNNSINKTIIE